MDRLTRRFTLAIPLTMFAMAGVTGTGQALAAGDKTEKKAAPVSSSPLMSTTDLYFNMRRLWEDHITYTRNFIISSIAGLGDTQAVTERLLRNQDDIGGAVGPIYGEAAAKKLAALLRGHILIAADIVKAAKAKDNKAVEAGEAKWRDNADEIAAFLASANPQWQKTMLAQMLYKHLDFTTTEVVSRLKKDWVADIQAYDQGHEHMLMFADALSAGIIKQNPTKFSRESHAAAMPAAPEPTKSVAAH